MARHSLKLHAQALIAAFQFLTRLPVPIQVPFEGAVLSRSVIYFPLAGAAIGMVTCAAAWLTGLVLPPLPGAVIVLAIWTALSGGLHMDGWMDTADGVLSHRSRERMLEIMKDSRVGAMGVIAAVLLLLLKASLLAELLQEERQATALFMLAATPGWGRAWMAAAIAIWPNARQGEGLGAMFGGVRIEQAGCAFLLAAAATFGLLTAAGLAFLFNAAAVAAAVSVTVLCGAFSAAWLNRKLGGLTGDTYGAMNEAVEAALLLVAVIWLHAA
ncbi:adenosylcobinamide-GDP ribazoletransferase [Paenibacillus sp. N4]|uniref:adenosylcobinamide-GDP ribazoletransferase n=1 Tax=Paenibacillus vietnamensis TaxID=2590547 RepID=UPI001CD0A763|nr:adenosylcobinamide-GDP ribazoletransferase [Paenibacillus vietnamensis]MCA0754140.1 adenosylcobinamide-GDP ribazoletransferase [Paenibacillus vietnamensis]